MSLFSDSKLNSGHRTYGNSYVLFLILTILFYEMILQDELLSVHLEITISQEPLMKFNRLGCI